MNARTVVRFRVMANTVVLFALMVGLKGTFALAEETPGADKWRIAYITTESPDELLPLYASDKRISTTLGGYYAGVMVMFREELSLEDTLVPVCVGPLDDPASIQGYMDRLSLIEWDYSDTDAVKPIPHNPILIVQNPNELDWLNLRERPSTSSRVIEQYRNGAAVGVLGMVGEWLHVAAGDAVGFMSPHFLSPIGEARVLTTDEFTFGSEEIPITIQLLETGASPNVNEGIPGARTEFIRLMDARHEIVQTIQVQSAGQLDRDANLILEDMNFDGYPDIRALASCQGDDAQYQYWLFDPEYYSEDTYNKWRFIRHESFEALENEPTFDAEVKRVYTHFTKGEAEYPTYVDSVYELVNDAPRLIESLQTTVLPDNRLRFAQYGLQGDELTLMHEWDEAVF